MEAPKACPNRVTFAF